MNNKKLHALIALLDDPDDSVFQMVEQEILKEDPGIVKELEHIWETSLDEIMQGRIENLIQQIQLNDTKQKIKKWSIHKDVDLFDGFFLISRYQYPDLRLKTVQNQLDKIRKDVWLEFNNSLTSLEKITVLNHIIYDVYKFAINYSNINSPQNSYINQLLETRKGNSISIAILYVLVARALELPVHFIDFPKNPLLAYVDKSISSEISENKARNDDILFYINPSNKGAIIGRKEIEFFLKKNESMERSIFFRPSTDRDIIKKLLESLINSYQELGYQDKVSYLSDIFELL